MSCKRISIRSLKRIVALLDAFNIQVVTVEGYEADDVIGTLASLAQASSLNSVIVSGDKDFQQLVAPDVWLLNPGRGGPAAVDEHWVGMENASERLGVPPERVIDYLALVGDTSDNVPGVKGIGEKTAVELITKYGGLDQILAKRREHYQQAATRSIARARSRGAALEGTRDHPARRAGVAHARQVQGAGCRS